MERKTEPLMQTARKPLASRPAGYPLRASPFGLRCLWAPGRIEGVVGSTDHLKRGARGAFSAAIRGGETASLAPRYKVAGTPATHANSVLGAVSTGTSEASEARSKSVVDWYEVERSEDLE